MLVRKEEIHVLKNGGDSMMQAICFYSSPTDSDEYTYHLMSAVNVAAGAIGAEGAASGAGAAGLSDAGGAAGAGWQAAVV